MEKGTGGLTGYNEFFDCEDSLLEFKLLSSRLRLSGDGSTVFEPCQADSWANAADAVCGMEPEPEPKPLIYFSCSYANQNTPPKIRHLKYAT